MKTRILSAIVGISFAVGLIILGTFYSVVVEISLGAVAVMCVVEALTAKKLAKKYRISVPCIAFAAATVLCYRFSFFPIIIYAFFLSVFAVMIFNSEKLDYNELSHAITVTILCTFGMLSTIYLFDLYKGIVGIFYVVLVLATPWLADSGAYFGGSLLGKKKLCPKISPKKTVEGAISGVIVGTVLPALVGIIFQMFFFKSGEVVHYLPIIVFAFVGSIVSILGDLSFSLIKRNCGVKDFGTLIPGHGGILDRFDSVIFTAPLLLIFNAYFPIITL